MKVLRFIILLSFLSKMAFGQKSPYKFSEQIIADFIKDTIPGKNTLASWDLSYIGEYRQMLQMTDTNLYSDSLKMLYPFLANKSTFLSKSDSLNFMRFKPYDASKYIAAKAKTEKIIIINEAHQQPMHRVFTESILQELYDNGFRYFGIETLSYSDTNLNKRKYPIMSSGYYSIEPQYGNLIRKALEIGFYVFPYEVKGKVDGKTREITQANNIKKILQKDSSAKILIHCGFAHACESPMRTWEYAMAGRLKQFTGIDPLTIDQIELTETSSNAYDKPYFRIINLDFNAVFIDSAGNIFGEAEGYEKFDINVYHPRTKWIHGRPDWVFTNKTPTSIVSKIKLTFPCLVFAYKENEDIKNAVPVDIIEIKSKNDDKYLALYTGKYLIVIKNKAGQEQKIEIKN